MSLSGKALKKDYVQAEPARLAYTYIDAVVLLLGGALWLVWYAWPVASVGAADNNMVLFFNGDDGELLRFWKQLYSEGVLPSEFGTAYPGGFYYLAGVVLFPYTFLNGLNIELYIWVYRAIQYSSVLLIGLTTYLIGAKLLQSRLTGILTAITIFISGNIISWTLRIGMPHALSCALSLLASYFLASWVLHSKPRDFWLAVLCSALSFATYYQFGWFIGPVILVILIIKLWQTSVNPDDFFALRYVWLSRLYAGAIIAAETIGIGLLQLALPVVFEKFPRYTRYATEAEQLATSLTNLLLMVMAGGLVWLGLQLWLAYKPGQAWHGLYVFNEIVFRACVLVTVYLVIFLILNPNWLVYPIESATAFVATVRVIGGGEGWGEARVATPLDWLPIIADASVFHLTGLLFFGGYLLWEFITFRHHWVQTKRLLLARLTLLGIISLHLTYLLPLQFQKSYYIMPSFPLIVGLGIYMIVRLSSQLEQPSLRWGVIVMFAVLLIWGWGAKASAALTIRQNMIISRADSVIYPVRAWLQNNVAPESSICIENKFAYVPDEYTNVTDIWDDYYFDQQYPYVDGVFQYDCQYVIDYYRRYPQLSEFLATSSDYQAVVEFRYAGTEDIFKHHSESTFWGDSWKRVQADPYVRIYRRTYACHSERSEESLEFRSNREV